MKGILYRTFYYIKRCGLGYIVDICKGNGRSRDTNKKLYRYFDNLPESQYKEELYKYICTFVQNGERYNLDHPRTFNEKIQWLKLHDATPMKSRLADKYAVREWITETIGEEYLIPLVGGPWKTGKNINFDLLPMQFALKANHGSGMNLIIKDKSQMNYTEAAKLADTWMETLYGWNGMETHYFEIPRLIFAEQYIEQSDGNLVDYKFHCFNGKPYVLQIIGDRNLNGHKGYEIFVDMNWNKREVGDHSYKQYNEIPSKPKNFEEMTMIAEKLACGFKYVRVDLYVINGKIYFGEMTFTPANGFELWNDAFQLELGNLIDINNT